MKKLILTTIVSAALTANLFAQQDPLMNQYLFCEMNMNPAVAGNTDYVSTTLTSRHQWVNLIGAPTTALLSGHGPLAKGKMGLGGVIGYDKIGVTTRMDVHANYAYRVKLTENSTLSFGVRAGVMNFNTDDAALVMWDTSDPLYNQNDRSAIVPSFGFGTHYQVQNYFVGISIPTLLAYSKGKDFGLEISKSSFLDRHYFLYTGYTFNLNEDFTLTPSVLCKYIPAAPFQADINAIVSYKEMVQLGASFRTGDAVSIMTQYITAIGLRIGYGFDVTITDIRKYESGTHTIMLGYNLTLNKTPDSRFINSETD